MPPPGVSALARGTGAFPAWHPGLQAPRPLNCGYFFNCIPPSVRVADQSKIETSNWLERSWAAWSGLATQRIAGTLAILRVLQSSNLNNLRCTGRACLSVVADLRREPASHVLLEAVGSIFSQVKAGMIHSKKRIYLFSSVQLSCISVTTSGPSKQASVIQQRVREHWKRCRFRNGSSSAFACSSCSRTRAGSRSLCRGCMISLGPDLASNVKGNQHGEPEPVLHRGSGPLLHNLLLDMKRIKFYGTKAIKTQHIVVLVAFSMLKA